jgi:WD40 repeat protein
MGHDLHGAPVTSPPGMPVVVGIHRSLANAGRRARRQESGNRNCRLLSSPRARYCRRHSVESGPGDPNAPTRTVLPGGSDAATDEGGDPDRTRSSADQTLASAAGTPRSGAEKARRPAPLQYRDPERYEVIAEHGRGGLGRVMRARDKELGRPVAIKEMLHPGMTSELRFFREALITARLEHPGIVPVHEAGRWPDGTPFYAMKLVAGRPLKAVIEDATSLDARLALLPHVIAVADAVAYAHSRGIIHRDLKPSNVIVGDFGETVVIDWGLAKDVAEPDDAPPSSDAPAAPGLTIAGTVLGTPGYMSPEQAAGTADTRSDIFAIGALLSHVLHGQPPAGASGAPAEPAPARSSSKVPAALQAIVAKATAADPAHRYATARALGDDLRQHQSGKLVTAHRYSLAQLAHHWATHNRRLLVVALAALLVSTAAVGMSVSRVIASRTAAEGARDEAEREKQTLVLSHARASLRDDPTRSLLWLDKYAGPDWAAAQDIAAEAIARGVSRYVLNGRATNLTVIAAGSGDTFFAAGGDSYLRRWSLHDRKGTFVVVDAAMSDTATLDYSPTSARLVRSSRDGIVLLHEGAEEPRPIARFDTPPKALSLSERGTKAVALLADHRIVVIDAGDPARVLLDETVPGLVSFELVGEATLATLRADGAATLWTLADVTKSTYPLGALAIGHVNRSGTMVAMHQGGLLSVLSAAGSKRSFSVGLDCQRIRVSPASDLAALQCGDSLHFVSLTDGVVAARFPHPRPTAATRFSPDGRWYASASLDGTILVVSTSSLASERLYGHAAGVHSAMDFVGDTLVAGDELGAIRVWPLRQPPRGTDVPGGDLRRVVASPDGKWFATDSNAGKVRLWDMSGTLVREFHGHRGVIPVLAFSPDSRFVLTPGWDGRLGVWPASAEGEGRLLRVGTDEVVNLTTTASGPITASADGTIRLWSLHAGEWKRIGSIGSEPYFVSAALPIVVSGGHDGVIHRFDESGEISARVGTVSGPLAGLRFSRDGRLLVAASEQGDVRVIDPSSFAVIARIDAGAPVVTFSLSPDGESVALALGDRTVRVHRLPDLSVRAVRLAHVKRMTFSRDGRLLAAACHDGVARVWSLDGTTVASQVFALNDDPIGVAISAPGDVLAVTTRFRFLTFPIRQVPAAGATEAAVRRQISDTLRSHQRPRSMAPEEKVLSYEED